MSESPPSGRSPDSLSQAELYRLLTEGRTEKVREEELARWAAGELSDEERIALLERLAEDPEGIELWRVADGVARGAERSTPAAPAPGSQDTPSPLVLPRATPALTPRSRLRSLLVPLVASWLVAALGLGLWVAARLELRELRSAQSTPLTTELLSRVVEVRLDAVRGSGDPLPVLTLSPDTVDAEIPLLLHLPQLRGATAVEVGLFDRSGNLEWSHQQELPAVSAPESAPEPPFSLLVRLPAGALTGPASRRLTVVIRGATEEVFELELRVQHPPS